MKQFILIVVAVFTSLLSFTQNDSTLYSFFVAGHTYGNNGVNNIGFHPPFKNKFGYIQGRSEIKFGVLTGDIVSPSPVKKDWDEIDMDIVSLGLPVYFSVGNHDMENRPLYESRYGNTYYDFEYENDLFIVLDPNIDGWSITGDQLTFLKNTLNSKAGTVDNIYVFVHQVLWREFDNPFSYITLNSYAGKGSPINFWSVIEPLFRGVSNDVVMFAGDVGVSWASDATFDSYDNITLITSGMGDPDGENFIVVNVDTSKSIDYDLICLSSNDMDCLGDLEDLLVVDKLTSLDVEIEGKHSFSLTSNLVNNRVGLNFITNEAVTIQLYNVSGQLVFQKKLEGEFKYEIDVSNIPKGLYILKTPECGECLAIKLII